MTEIEELAQELVEVINGTELRERRKAYGVTYMLNVYKSLEAALKANKH